MGTDYTKVNETQEILCQVITQIVQSELKGIKYDKTVKCTISDDSGAAYGYYKVSEGANEYVAYARENETYKNGDVVYITIPNGDYDEQKFIMGKGFDNDEPNYSPLKNFISVEKAVSPALIGIMANGEERTKEIPAPPDTDGWISSLNLDLNDGKDITHLAISAKFSTMLPTCRKGVFGIKITFKYTNNQNIALTETAYFISPDMYGTIYQLKETTQKYILSLASLDIKKIDDVKFELYQQGDFIDANGRLIGEFIDANGNLATSKINNITIKGFTVEAGYSIKNFAPNSIILYNNVIQTTYDSEAALPPIYWIFNTEHKNNTYQRWIREQRIDTDDRYYSWCVLEYVPSFVASDNNNFERDQWQLNNSLVQIDESGRSYIQMFGNIEQDQVGFELVLYELLNNGNKKKVDSAKMIFYKREKKEA